MRKLMLILAVMMMLAGFAAPVRAERPRIILYTAYRQMGWGDAVQLGCVDEDGGLWGAAGYDSQLQWPYGWEKQIAYLQSSDSLAEMGRLSRDELSSLKSLIGSVQIPEAKPAGWMCDAGTESSYAVRYNRNGNAEAVLLGMTGDDFLENTDPGAQSLYKKLHTLFPFVRCYGGEISEAWGFQPVPVAVFCRMENVDWDSVTVSACHTDCEAGPRELEVTEDEAKWVIEFMKAAQVTGKENAMCVTGGTTILYFTDSEGNGLGTVELYNGLLVMNDGMYHVEGGGGINE